MWQRVVRLSRDILVWDSRMRCWLIPAFFPDVWVIRSAHIFESNVLTAVVVCAESSECEPCAAPGSPLLCFAALQRSACPCTYMGPACMQPYFRGFCRTAPRAVPCVYAAPSQRERRGGAHVRHAGLARSPCRQGTVRGGTPRNGPCP